jgi:hypothetical protein
MDGTGTEYAEADGESEGRVAEGVVGDSGNECQKKRGQQMRRENLGGGQGTHCVVAAFGVCGSLNTEIGTDQTESDASFQREGC